MARLPIGYWDGLDRKLSNTGRVLVRGRRAPTVGRVCMNTMIVDVTEIEGVTVGDEVVVIGRQNEETITVEEVAQRLTMLGLKLEGSVG